MLLLWWVLLPRALSAVSPYRDMSYDEMVDSVVSLAATVPEYVRVFSGNKAYGVLPASGSCGEKYVACEQWVVVLTDFATYELRDAGRESGEGLEDLESSSSSSSSRAEFFLSGALHGDERVGPLATLATLRMLAFGAAKETRGTFPDLATEGERKALSDPLRSRWMHSLVKNRVVYAMPATNAVGFAKRTRAENRMDPNRDFPIDTSPGLCMRTVSGRVVNELFRRHIFQIALTFHGGMRAIAYEWGAPT